MGERKKRHRKAFSFDVRCSSKCAEDTLSVWIGDIQPHPVACKLPKRRPWKPAAHPTPPTPFTSPPHIPWPFSGEKPRVIILAAFQEGLIKDDLFHLKSTSLSRLMILPPPIMQQPQPPSPPLHRLCFTRGHVRKLEPIMTAA